MLELTEEIKKYSVEPENAEKNFILANLYDGMGQTAAAISFYLRAAERTEDQDLMYECMVKVGNCFDKQGNRHNTVRGIYKHAIRLRPDRPEAYYLLAKFDNFYQNHVDAYIFSNIALESSNLDSVKLRTDVGYVGKYGLLYEKAVSSWLWGKIEECYSLFSDIVKNHWNYLNPWYQTSTKNCLKNHGFPDLLNLIQPRKKVDCFTYYDETSKEMLLLRYLIMNDHVDHFVVSESNRTQIGKLIQRKLRQTLKELNIPSDKFIFADVDIPDDDNLQIEEIDKLNSYQNQNNESYKTRARERLQKNGLHQVLDQFDNDTIFIVSDCDEIIDAVRHLPNVIDIVSKNRDRVIKIPLVHTEGRANLRVMNTTKVTPKQWDGAMFVCTKEHLLKATVIQIRSNIYNPYNIAYITYEGKRIEDMGWHFSWMGDANRRKKKLSGFVHSNEKLDFLKTNSYDSKETLERMEIEPRIGDISISCEANTILVPYPDEKLPNIIFQNKILNDFFINGINYDSEEDYVSKLLENEYQNACSSQTDIFKHLPTLRNLAKECNHVTEMGVRTGQSTRALLVEPVILRSYDLYLDNDVSKLFELARSADKDVQYIQADTLKLEIEETDLLFIDTEHTYEQLSAELELHHNKARKYIAFHDTDKPYAEVLLPAIIEFMIKHPEWDFHYHSKECHGFTVIRRKQ